MDIKTAIIHYYPYWLMGIFMIIATLRSEHKDLMRIQKSSLLKFAKRMALVTAIRCIFMFFFPPTITSVAPVLQIPLWLTFMVWWEDPCHTLILALMSRFLGDSKPAKIIQYILTGLVMVSFSLGHLYQGIFTACMLSFYIPIVTSLGKKHGFGTIILCHIAYDFLTLLTVRLFLGL